MDLLDHQLLQIGQHVGEGSRLAALPGGHVVENGIFPQIEADHLRHIGVDGLVIRHPGADGIGQHHAAGAVDREQARHADEGVRVEGEGVQEVVVDAAIDDIHPFQPSGGAHQHLTILDHQIRALHQLHPHLLGEEAVLEVGAVEAPRGHHHHAGVVHRAALAQGLQQQGRVALHRRDGLVVKQLREEAHHHLAVLQHVGDPGGGAQVVLQHIVLTVVVADDVDPGDVDIGVPVQVDPLHAGLVLGIGEDLGGRDHPRLQDALIVIDVVQKGVEGGDALADPLVQMLPLPGGNDAGNAVERDEALGAVPIPVDVEGDADPAKQQIGLLTLALYALLVGLVQPREVGVVMIAKLVVGEQHLVVTTGSGGLDGQHRQLLVTSLISGVARGVPANRVAAEACIINFL